MLIVAVVSCGYLACDDPIDPTLLPDAGLDAKAPLDDGAALDGQSPDGSTSDGSAAVDGASDSAADAEDASEDASEDAIDDSPTSNG
jgi:hypothetical protein